MSKTTRSDREIEDIRNTILDEALELLRNEGFENLSMYKLGRRTNMTAANLYNYYKNKDQLIIAIHKRTFEMLYKMFLDAVAGEKNPVEKLKKVIKTFLDFAKTYPNYYDLMFNRHVPQVSDYKGTPEEIISRDEYQSSIRNLNLVINIGREIKSLHPELEGVDVEFYSIRILSELHGLLSLYNSGLLKELVENPDTLINRIADDLLALYVSKK